MGLADKTDIHWIGVALVVNVGMLYILYVFR